MGRWLLHALQCRANTSILSAQKLNWDRVWLQHQAGEEGETLERMSGNSGKHFWSGM